MPAKAKKNKPRDKAVSGKVTIETVKRVAGVARLHLTEAEIKRFQKDLNDILAAFRELDKAKPKCEASFQPFEIKDVTREDRIEESLTQENALANTKHKQDGYFKGPRAV